MADPLALSVGVQDLLAALTPREVDAVGTGALDPREVWYEFVTLKDDRVRPSHRALDGTVWKAGDPNAPVPPLDYGCRCYIRYVAPPRSVAAARRLLPASPKAEPDTTAEVYRAYLAREVKGLDLIKAAQAVRELPPADQLPVLVEVIQRADPSWTAGAARDLARMALQAVGRLPASGVRLTPLPPAPLRPFTPPGAA